MSGIQEKVPDEKTESRFGNPAERVPERKADNGCGNPTEQFPEEKAENRRGNPTEQSSERKADNGCGNPAEQSSERKTENSCDIPTGQSYGKIQEKPAGCLQEQPARSGYAQTARNVQGQSAAEKPWQVSGNIPGYRSVNTAADTRQAVSENLCVFALILTNILVFLLISMYGNTEDSTFMIRCGAMYHPLTLSGGFYRLFTAMFLHFDISHLLSNMLSLFALGSIIEKAFGRKRFLLIYFVSGLGAGLASTFFHAWKDAAAVCAGASGAVFGLAGALVCLAVFKKTEAYGINSRRVPLAIGISVAVSASYSSDTAAHIAGLVCGFLIAALLSLKLTSGKHPSNIHSKEN